MEKQQLQVKWYGYIALVVGILFFSGIFADAEGPLSTLDFGNLLGRLGALGTVTEQGREYVTLASDFRGSGGNGAREGFMFALTLAPAVLLALGTVSVVEHLDGLNAAAKLLNIVLRPLMGIPGVSALGLMASLQSVDAGASMTKQLYDAELLTDNERLIFTTFQFSGAAVLINYFASGAAMFPYLGILGIPIILPMAVIFLFKILGANLMRLYIRRFLKGEV